MTATIDEVAKTLGEFEALAQKTGEWDGADAVEFSNDGVTWSPVWMQSAQHISETETQLVQWPAFARARVYRKGVAHVDWQYVAWDESVPADNEWRDLWMRKPSKLFGSFALRSAYRHAFRDVVGDLRGPDEDDPKTTSDATPAAPRDWASEYDAATTVEQLDDIHKDCRTARQNTMELQEHWRTRRAQLVDAEWTAPAPALSPEEAIRHAAFFEQPEQPERTRPVPQDHLPSANRAARRASKRKGRR